MSVADKLAGKSAAQRPPNHEVRLKIAHIGVWSAAKLSFVIGCGMAVVSLILTLVLWAVLNQAGAFDQLDLALAGISASAGSGVKSIFGFGPVLGFAVVVGLLNVVTTTALGAVLAALYNLSVRVIGGILVGMRNK